jgi:hypothetical protein
MGDVDRPESGPALGDGKVGRRGLLGGALLGTGAFAVTRGNINAAYGATRARRSRLLRQRGDARAEAAQAKGGRTARTAESLKASTPDGFLPNSIQGLLVSARGNSFVLAAGPSLQPIRVTLQPGTDVWAGGYHRQGDASLCNVGDNVFAETAFTPGGARVAKWLEANSAVYWGVVRAVTPTSVTVATKLGYGNGAGATLEIRYMPMTNLTTGAPNVGDSIYCVATTSSPSNANPGTIWARYVETWQGAGSYGVG